MIIPLVSSNSSYWLDTGTLIEHGGVNLVLLAQTSSLTEIKRSKNMFMS
jgi:hypothetical protein